MDQGFAKQAKNLLNKVINRAESHYYGSRICLKGKDLLNKVKKEQNLTAMDQGFAKQAKDLLNKVIIRAESQYYGSRICLIGQGFIK